MIIKEIYNYFKSKKKLVILLVSQLSLFFILLGTFMGFTKELSFGKRNLETLYNGKLIYHLLDGYRDPAEFTKFYNEDNSLNKIKSFYNKLDTAKTFQYLAMCTQKIDILPFAESEIAKNEADNSVEYIKVNSYQINQRAQEYFKLKLSDGRFFNTNDFDNTDKIMPVILGSHYREFFEVGDSIKAIIYQKEFELHVIGFLNKDSYIFYNGNPEFYLDDYIVWPFINYNAPKTDEDEDFQKIVYFSMINGYISIEDNRDASTAMKFELEAIAKESNFYNYFFIGSNPNVQQYRGLINVIDANNNLVAIIFNISFILNIMIVSAMLYFEQKKRLHYCAIQYLHGASISKIIQTMVYQIFAIIITSFFISQFVLKYILKITAFYATLIMLLIAVILTILVSILPICAIVHKPLISLLNSEEEIH